MVEALTADQAAEKLRVKPSWLERQASQRKIPFTMLGGSYHFTESHLSEIVRMFEVSPAASVPEPTELSAMRARRRPDGVPRSPKAPLVARPRAAAIRKATAA
jgi:excisionase family DNA binding protein